MKRLVTLTALLAAALVASASASLVNLDVGQGPVFTGAGVAGGGLWNAVTNVGQQNNTLLDSTGTATGIHVEFFSINDFMDNTGGAVPANNPATAALLEDYGETAFNNSVSFRITGLVPFQSFDLTVYAAGSTGAGVIFNANFPGTTTGTTRGAFVSGDNYLRHTVTADANGTFFTGGGGTNGFSAPINGLQILTVPEPGTWALMFGGFGVLGVVVLRRHRGGFHGASAADPHAGR